MTALTHRDQALDSLDTVRTREGLSEDEKQRLWLTEAVVHALLAVGDEIAKARLEGSA